MIWLFSPKNVSFFPTNFNCTPLNSPLPKNCVKSKLWFHFTHDFKEDAETIWRLMGMGVDVVCTNRPDLWPLPQEVEWHAKMEKEEEERRLAENKGEGEASDEL